MASTPKSMGLQLSSQSASAKGNEKFDLIFSILTELQNRQAAWIANSYSVMEVVFLGLERQQVRHMCAYKR